MGSASPTDSSFDTRLMAYALRVAERGIGRTGENPSVGCVIAKGGRILGVARTADGGRPHAETQALHMAGAEAQGATAYVTLEPCAHHGKTPPCAEALIAAGIAQVVIACADADSRVAGKGIALLQQAGVAVKTGLLRAEAEAQHRGFFRRLRHGLPALDLKLATSLDGKIANAAGHSQWITGEEARAHAHGLRARYDAILTGIGTVLADDPALTCRLPGLESYSPVRVVLDSALRLPPESQLVRTAREVPVWVLTASDDAAKTTALTALGVQVAQTGTDAEGRVEVQAALRWLAAQGINRVLAEGGAGLNGSLWRSGLVETLYWYRAPIVLAGGMDAIGGSEAGAPSALPRLHRKNLIALGSDTLEIYNARDCL